MSTADESKLTLATSLLAIGDKHVRLGQIDKAFEQYSNAVILVRDLKDSEGRFVLYRHLGVACADASRWVEAAEYLNVALAISQRIAMPQLTARALLDLGRVGLAQGEVSSARAQFDQALTLAKNMSDPALEIKALERLGDLEQAQGQSVRALDYHLLALEIARQQGDKTIEAGALGSLGDIYRETGEIDDAIDAYRQAVALARESGNAQREETWSLQLGDALRQRGQVEQAVTFYQRTLELTQTSDRRANEAAALEGLANAHAALDLSDEALKFAERALAMARKLGDSDMERQLATLMGLLRARNGDFGDTPAPRVREASLEGLPSAYAAEQSLALARRVGDGVLEGRAMIQIAQIRAHDGDEAGSRQWLEQARTALEKAGRPELFDEIQQQLAGAAPAPAADANPRQRALIVARQLGNRPAEAAALSGLAADAVERSQVIEAIGLYQKSLAIYQETQHREGESVCLGNLANLYAQHGQPKRAIELYQQAIAICWETHDTASEGRLLINLGLALNEEDKQAESLKALRDAEEIFEQLGTADMLSYVRGVIADLS